MRARVAFESVDAGEHARDVPVDQRDVLPERQRGDGGSGVRSEARQLAQFGSSPRKRAARRLRRFVQVARAGVVAEAAPEGEHVVEWRARQLAQRGKAREEAPVVGDDHVDARLLQHHLAHPDAVGIARLAAPRQIALVRPEPLQELCAKHARP